MCRGARVQAKENRRKAAVAFKLHLLEVFLRISNGIPISAVKSGSVSVYRTLFRLFPEGVEKSIVQDYWHEQQKQISSMRTNCETMLQNLGRASMSASLTK